MLNVFRKLRENRFRRIEKRIDNAFFNNDILKINTSTLIANFIMNYEIIRRFSSLLFPHNPFLNNPLLSSLPLGKILTSILLKKGEINNNELYIYTTPRDFVYINEKVIRSSNKSIDYFITSIGYHAFELYSKMYSRGFSDIKVKGKVIEFILKDDSYLQSAAFETMVSDKLKLYLIDCRYHNLVNKPYDPTHIQKLKTLSKWAKNNFPYIDNRILSESVLHKIICSARAVIDIINEVTINWTFGDYSLSDIREFWIYVLAKCKIFEMLDPIYSSYGEYQLYYAQERDRWIEEISEGTMLNKQVVDSILKDFTFNFKIANLGIQIQPFIELAKNTLALPPSLFISNNFEGNFLDLQCKINKKIYDRFSNEKENILVIELINLLKAKGDYLFKDRIKFLSRTNKSDIDLAALEITSGILFLIQLKWLLRPKNNLDCFNKEKEIEYGITQGKISIKYVENNLKQFICTHFPGTDINQIKYIKTLLLCRDNIGTKQKCYPENYVLDYNIFKFFLNLRNCHFINILELIEKNIWLPEKGADFDVGMSESSLEKYVIRIPGINIKENVNKDNIFGLQKLNDFYSKLKVNKDC